MKRISRILARSWPLLVWIGVALILFWPVRGYYVVLPSPDSAPFFPAAYRLRLLDQMLVGAIAISPHHLFSLLLPPLIHHDLIYLLDTLLIAAGCAYFLRGRDLPPVAAWIGGGILAFAGYSFTLISAGHMGFFHMTVYATFMFGFLVRALRYGRWPYFALTGLCGAWVVLYGPDFGPILLLLAAAYGLWLLLGNAAQQPWRFRLRGLAVGVPIAALCFLLGAWSTIRIILTEHVQKRESQIQATAPRSTGSETDTAAASDPQDKWIFATNWSLPPSEIVEFVAPCLFGAQSGDRQAPYWGKLGRTLGWEEHRQGFPNFRQHAIYLGGLQLMLAAFAVFAWLRRRKWGRGDRVQGSEVRGQELGVSRPRGCAANDREANSNVQRPTPRVWARGPESGVRSPESNLSVERSADPLKDQVAPWLSDVPFWAGVWLIGLLLAFGRHAPLYRLFYSLPYMSLLRAPVKFIRFVELATAILAASGLACLLQPPLRRLRGWVIAAGVCAGIGLLAALWMSGADAGLRQTLEPLGLAPAATLLKGNLIRALLHGSVAFAVTGMLFFLRGRLRHSMLPLLLLVTAWLAIDMALVDRRFITAADITPYYQLNRVSRVLLAERTPGITIADYLAVGQERDWYNKSLWTRQIVNCVRSVHLTTDPYVKLMTALELDPVQFWRLAGAGYAVVPLRFARSLPADAGKVMDIFSIGSGRLVDARSEADAVALFKVGHLPPYAWLSSAWQSVPDEKNLTALLAQKDSASVATVSGEVQASPTEVLPAGRVTVRSERYRAGSLKTVVDVEVPATQMLTVRMLYERDIVPKIDGQTVALLRSNHLWCGVAVPAGHHTVTFTTVRSFTKTAIAFVPVVVLLILIIGTYCLQRKNV